MCISRRFRNGRFTLGRKSEIMNGDKIAENARIQEKLWRTLVPEKYLSVKSSSFFFLAALTIALHQYNSQRERSRQAESLSKS